MDNNSNNLTPCQGYIRFRNMYERHGFAEENIPTEQEWCKLIDTDFNEVEPAPLKPSEMLDIFEEAPTVLKKNHAIAQAEYNVVEYVAHILVDRWMHEVHTNFSHLPTDERKKLVMFGAKYLYYEALRPLEKRIAWFERMLRIVDFKRMKPHKGVTEIDIVAAKEFPITTFVQPNRSGFIVCPFHPDTMPSCKIYENQNRWYCYGCSQGGDVIDWVMKTENCEFVDAIKKILKR